MKKRHLFKTDNKKTFANTNKQNKGGKRQREREREREKRRKKCFKFVIHKQQQQTV